MAVNTRFATGVQALVMLAIEPDRVHTSDNVARALDTNSVVVRRLFSQLQKAGLIKSHKGPTGGSRLNRSPKNITLRDVHRATDAGDLPDAPASSGVPGLQSALKDAFSAATRAYEKELDEVTLAQLAKKAAKKSKRSASAKASKRRS